MRWQAESRYMSLSGLSERVESSAPPVRILIIEDNPIDRDLCKRMLRVAQQRSAGVFECVEGEHGRAGLEEYRRVRPDCVMLDLHLPDIDGLELLRSILSEPDACPVIVMTAYGNEQVAVQAMKAGAADYLVKGSITGEVLAHVIENALEKRGLQREVERQRVAIEQRNRQLEQALERETAARREVEQSESRYRTLAEAMPQLVWTADHPGGRWDYVNQRWTSLTGAPAREAFDSGWLEFIDPEDRSRVADAWRSAVERGTAVELECRIRAADQTPRWQLMRAVPLMQDVLPVKWLGTFTDVDDQRRTEQLLHHRQKIESIGILAGGVAHDFNNLLVGIIGGLSYALDVMPADHELRPILELAFKSGERAAQLTRQMLAYAGKGANRIEDVDLGKNLHATWELIHASLPRSIDLKVVIPPDLPAIRTDPAQLQQIIMNLILNASEAIPQERHGLVVVRAGVVRLTEARSTLNGDVVPGEYVELEVRDNGMGIDPALLNKIFDPFFSTKFTGRGLGLAAVQGIVRSNHGSIEVSSVQGQGATFRVLLPSSARRSATTSSSAAEDVAAPGKARVLVVDDEPVVCNTARAILEHSGYAVEVVYSGQEALDRIDVSQDFSLVLLDLNMPGLDGRATFEAIRSAHPELKVLICSGYSDREARNRFHDRRVEGFLQKPFQARSLARMVAEVLGNG